MLEVDKILKKISRYLREYRKKNGITQFEMADLIGLSISRYSEVERNMGHSGMALKTLMIIASLEYDSIVEFLESLDSRNRIRKSEAKKEPLLDLFDQLNNLQKEVFVKHIQKNNPRHNTIPNRLKWAFDLMNMMLEGKNQQLEEIELMILNYYLKQINKSSDKSKVVKSRAIKLVRNM